MGGCRNAAWRTRVGVLPADDRPGFNWCTNFNAKVDISVPSVSCSGDAVGRASGMAGLVHSAALNTRAAGTLASRPSCKRVGGQACALSPAEVKQVMASGEQGDQSIPDDVDFSQAELSCPAPGCTDPFLGAPTDRIALPSVTPPRSYPARGGHDQFCGYGRVNMNRTLRAVKAGKVLPEAEITGPEWYGFADPTKPSFDVRGRIWARGTTYTCRLLVAPGGYPGLADFKAAPVSNTPCDGTTARSMPLDGVLGKVDTAALKALYPSGSIDADFRGVEHGQAGTQPHSGRTRSPTRS